MQNSIWKLAALAVVVGIGFISIIQVQRVLLNHDSDLLTQITNPDSPGDENSDSESELGPNDDGFGSEDDAEDDEFFGGDQNEPAFDENDDDSDDTSEQRRHSSRRLAEANSKRRSSTAFDNFDDDPTTESVQSNYEQEQGKRESPTLASAEDDWESDDEESPLPERTAEQTEDDSDDWDDDTFSDFSTDDESEATNTLAPNPLKPQPLVPEADSFGDDPAAEMADDEEEFEPTSAPGTLTPAEGDEDPFGDNFEDDDTDPVGDESDNGEMDENESLDSEPSVSSVDDDDTWGDDAFDDVESDDETNNSTDDQEPTPAMLKPASPKLLEVPQRKQRDRSLITIRQRDRRSAKEKSRESEFDYEDDEKVTHSDGSSIDSDSESLQLTADELEGDGVIDKTVILGKEQPHIRIEKNAPPNAILGEPLVYTIVVRNTGNGVARQVQVEDRIPKGSKLMGTIPQAEILKKKLIWRFDTIEPNEEKKISIRITPTSEGEIGSVATVNYVAAVAARTRITAPKLDFEVIAPKQVRLGKPVTVRFLLANNGTGTAENVVIRSILPAQLRHVSGNDLEYTVGTMPPGKQVEIKLTLKAVEVGLVAVNPVVTAKSGLKTEAQMELEVTGHQLVLQRSGPRRHYVGRTAVFTNEIGNNSDEWVEDITVHEIVPRGMEFVKASDGGQYNSATRTVSWRIDRIDSQESESVSVTLKSIRKGSQKSKVEVVGPDGQKTTISAETQATGYSEMRVRVSDNDGPLDVGQTTKIRISARNRGSMKATDVEMQLIVPDELELVKIDGPVEYTQDGNRVEFHMIRSISESKAVTFDVFLRAVQPGDARLEIIIDSEQMDRPLRQEKAIRVFKNSQ